MANQSPPPSPGASRRRSSFAELFNPRGATSSSPPTAPVSSSVPVSIPSPTQNRGMSITTLGLAGSNTSPFNAFAKQRRASISTSTGSGSPEFRNSFGDEPAVIEEDDSSRASFNPPASPSIGRRMSFGAQALRDRTGSNIAASGGGRRPSSQYLSKVDENSAPVSNSSPSTAKAAGEGFNWSEALRDSTKKRSPSFSASSNPFASRVGGRVMSASPAAEPPKEMPKPVAIPTRMQKPDHLGERMLRGDFMMD